MATEEVEVVITPDGKVTMHVKGIEGQACLAETQRLVEILGGEVEQQEWTAEAYITTEDQQEDRQWH